MSRCGCPVAAPIIMGGVVVCGSCKLPPVYVLAELAGENVQRPDEVSTIMRPVDCPSADTFNRACRGGRVQGARKVGRVWICTRAAWEQRTRTAPNVSPEARERARAKRLGPPKVPSAPAAADDGLDAGTLAEMGARRAS